MAQIRLERTDTPRCEVFHPLERLKQGLLDKVLGIGDIARPLRQPAAGPAFERLSMPRKEPFERFGVAGARAIDQGGGRIEVGRWPWGGPWGAPVGETATFGHDNARNEKEVLILLRWR